MLQLVLVVAALFGAGVFLVTSSLFEAAPEADMIQVRLGTAYQAGHELEFEDAEMAVPFAERVLKPLFGRVARMLARQQPAEKLRDLQMQLNRAERPWGLDAGGFLLLQLVAFPVGVGAGTLLGSIMGAGGTLSIAVPAGTGALFYFLPKSKVKSRIKKRTKEIELALPDAIDLLTISVEAGTTFDSALSRVTEKFHNALAREFKRTLHEIRLGRPRVEAITDLGRRNGVESLRNLCSAIIQAEQLGVGTAQVLRVQSEEMRRKRRQRAEELGAKAPLKMLFPMVGCIFPCLFVVLLGPAIINVALGAH